MKRLINTLAVLALLTAGFYSCTQEDGTANDVDLIPGEVLQKIAGLGFSTDNVIKDEEGGYIVEGDILLSNEDLNRGSLKAELLRIAGEEQYHTFNLVTGLPRTITITTSGGNITTGFSNAINAAIARYNAENLGLTFVRGGSSGGGTINIRIVNTGQYIAAAGFPDSNGNPFNDIRYARKYNNYSLGFMTTVLAHEIGHCIGFRHTDYMNRSFSCGSGGNEGQETTGVGAVHIPGTPTGPDAASWMLACLSSTTDRPFNANDKVALNYLY
ncbi:MAG TPA: M57 family metalloprotease [Saprospiraceae bacterium]|nr:M57 family metalloprotease [Saprospiraceae bacterium]HMP24230.1 M57 family metalloprotease [Saprospiraceae bacterium]